MDSMDSMDRDAGGARGPMGAAEAAALYRARGWQVIRLEKRSKRPTHAHWTEGADATGWEADDNIGVLTGAVGLGIVDVDLDTPEAAAAARLLLPSTGRVHGRAGKPASHYWYRVRELRVPNEPWRVQTAKFAFAAAAEGARAAPTMIAELRADGCQTMVPPSIHPSGEVLRWERRGAVEIVEYARLRTAVAETAACALLAAHWPAKGLRDEAALALAGALTHGGWPVPAIDRFVTSVARVAGDEEWASRDKAKGCAAKAAAGEPYWGVHALAQRLACEPARARAVVTQALTWLGIEPGGWEGRAGGKPPNRTLLGEKDFARERSLVAAAASDPRLARDLAARVRPGDFAQASVGEAFRIACHGREAIAAVEGEAGALMRALAAADPPAADAALRYADEVALRALRYRLRGAADEIARLAAGPAVEPRQLLRLCTDALARARDAAERQDAPLHLATVHELLAAPRPPSLIESYYSLDTTGILYARPGVGKSVLLLDQMAHVALGKQWEGLETRAGHVVYVCAEGQAFLSERLEALMLKLGVDDLPKLHVIPTAVQLLDPLAVDALLRVLDDALPERPVWVAFDTVSQTSGGGDENVATDMRDYLLAMDRIRRETGAFVQALHHSGKDESRGARGSSVFLANCDTVLSVRLADTEDAEGKPIAVLRSEKQRGGTRPPAPFHYTVEAVALQRGADGKPRTGPILRAVPQGTRQTTRPEAVLAGLSSTRATVLDTLVTLSTAATEQADHGEDGGWVRPVDWRHACVQAGVALRTYGDAAAFLRQRGFVLSRDDGAVRPSEAVLQAAHQAVPRARGDGGDGGGPDTLEGIAAAALSNLPDTDTANGNGGGGGEQQEVQNGEHHGEGADHDAA